MTVTPRRWLVSAIAVGGVALIIALLLGQANAASFFKAYLIAYTFWLGLALGSLAIALLQFITGGVWGLATRRVMEAGAATLPMLAVLFVPVVFGIPHLYVWADPAAVAADPVLQHKALYLNVPFFIARAVIYFVCWSALAVMLNRWSRTQDQRLEPQDLPRLQRLSVVGLLLLTVTVTFAAIDWLMSLEPLWYSTAFPVVVALGEMLAAFALAILVVTWLAPREPMRSIGSPGLFNDLGSLLLAFVMLWAYVGYFQFMLIWAGNLSEEIPYYLRRIDGSWQWVALLVVFGGFAIPFVLLLFRGLKRDPRTLRLIALLVVVMHLAEVYWRVGPALDPTGPRVDAFDLLLAVGIGCVWLAVFAWRLTGRPLLPPNDPRLARALELASEPA
jgi:hypothetical protein